MDWYPYIAGAAIIGQLLFVYFAVRNYRFALAKYHRARAMPRHPRVGLIVPCKGLDTRFHSNISSLFSQDYDNYRLVFVVQEEADPAYEQLRIIRDQLTAESQADRVEVLIAGLSTSCSQKIHNLLYAIEQLDDDTEVLAFADSDVCVPADWLHRLIRPLRRSSLGLSTGYRWFIPTENNLATLGLSAVNASVAQLLGNSPFNQAWGGSMAVRVADFRRLGLPKIWKSTLSDDLSLSQAIRKAGLKVAFVPGCLAASYESTTWAGLWEFGRRQFLITRIYAPATWWLGLLSSLGSVVGLWGSASIALYARSIGAGPMGLYAGVPVVFFAGQLCRVILRQSMIARILHRHAGRMKTAKLADLLGFWFWSLLLLAFIIASAFGRTIRWRGTRYRLISPTETEILET